MRGRNRPHLQVQVEQVAGAGHLPLPAYATEEASCADLRAAIQTEEWIHPGQQALIGTGLRIAIPDGFEAQVRPRSGLSSKGIHGVFGTIDADYQGEVKVILINLSDEPFLVKPGDRVGQLAMVPMPVKVVWVTNEDGLVAMAPTGRGAGGFGSTGMD